MAAARVLLVDDEAVLLELLKKYLERLGYQVEAYTSPQEALARFGENPKAYALVITDLTLPGLSGEHMLDRMRELCPELRAIVSSGYPYQPREKRTAFLQKPYLPRALAKAIEKALMS